MSLINEALKKAQSERPSSVHNHPAMQGTPGTQHQPGPPRKRRYLFGFLMAVLIVGLFSAGVSTYLVYTILDTEDGGSPPPVAATPAPAPTATVAQETSPAPAPTETANQVAETAPAPTQQAEPVAVAQPVIAAPQPAPEPVQEAAQPVLPEPQTVYVSDGQSHPEVWARLQELEIRGIMSGGSRVLIYDTRAARSKAYRPGDLVDGSLSLSIASITSTEIYFRTNDGSQFPKSF